MSTDAAIYSAFAVLVTSFAAGLSPPLPVAYPGIPFTPPTTGEWLELAWFPNETQNYAMDNAAGAVHSGFFQVAACERPGAGIMVGATLAGAVVSAFPKGTAFSGATVERKPWISSVLVMDEKLIYPVTVRYRSMV